MNGIQIYISYFSNYAFQGFWQTAYRKFCNYAHVMLGMTVFLVLYAIGSNLKVKKRRAM